MGEEVFIFGRRFETKQIYTTELPSDPTGLILGPLALAQITKIMGDYHRAEGLSQKWGYANRDFFPETWDWQWLPPKNAKITITDDKLEKPVVLQGTLPKRIQTFYYKAYGRTLPAHVVTALGNSVKLDMPELSIAHWDLTNHFDWPNGAYGDSGSCFWTTHERAPARDYIRNNGGYAIRFYNSKDGGKGIARAFLIPYHTVDGDETWVVTNGYGMTTQSIARFFGTETGKTYKILSVSVDGKWDGVVYINAAGKGYIVGGNDALDKIKNVDFKWNARYGTNSSDQDNSSVSNYCVHCNDPVDEDEARYINGDYWCQNCFWQTHTYCGHCHQEVSTEDVTFSVGADLDICESCLDSHYSTSSYDNEYYLQSELHEYEGVDSRGQHEELYLTNEQLDTYFVQLSWPKSHADRWTLQSDAEQISQTGGYTTWVHRSGQDATDDDDDLPPVKENPGSNLPLPGFPVPGTLAGDVAQLSALVNVEREAINNIVSALGLTQEQLGAFVGQARRNSAPITPINNGEPLTTIISTGTAGGGAGNTWYGYDVNDNPLPVVSIEPEMINPVLIPYIAYPAMPTAESLAALTINDLDDEDSSDDYDSAVDFDDEDDSYYDMDHEGDYDSSGEYDSDFDDVPDDGAQA